MTALIADLRRAARGEVVEQAPLAPRTSVRVGGAGELWVKPNDPGALVDVLGVLSWPPASPGSRSAAARTPSSATRA